jgi:hypothetical protein
LPGSIGGVAPGILGGGDIEQGHGGSVGESTDGWNAGAQLSSLT